MWKVKKWFERKTASKKEYEEEKRDFEMAIGKPYITLKIELPEGFEDQRQNFLKLEEDTEFIDEIKDHVKKNLLIKKGNSSNST
ncbi:MAG: hypothetical protein AC479_03615 [miscellaneous Crenarchaeota group-6 archaeon AD8-1]|nr:MAG: hypothetical protein AC479_03615 [miscellaneous Crenarchaeota group-6 archaeon AD8-1]